MILITCALRVAELPGKLNLPSLSADHLISNKAFLPESLSSLLHTAAAALRELAFAWHVFSTLGLSAFLGPYVSAASSATEQDPDVP